MPHCEQLLPQLDLCAYFISLWKLSFPEAGQLLQKAGHYLLLRGHYNRAETFLSNSLAILQHSSQSSDLSLASLINDLGMIYEEQGKYPQAETTYQRALSLREKLLPSDDPDLIETLLNTARLALTLAHYDQSEAVLQHILSLQTQLPLSNPLNFIPTLYQLANLHQQRGDYQQAEEVICRAISICQQNLGDAHPIVIEGQCKIALLYNMQEKHSQATDLASQIVDTLTRSAMLTIIKLFLACAAWDCSIAYRKNIPRLKLSYASQLPSANALSVLSILRRQKVYAAWLSSIKCRETTNKLYFS